MAQDPNPGVPPGPSLDLTANDLVTQLAEHFEDTGPPSFTLAVNELGAARAYAESSDVPELVTLVGYLGGTIPRPRSSEPDPASEWCVLYLGWDLRDWLLVERTGIVRRIRLKDQRTEELQLDVIWVKAEAGVVRGSGQLSGEAQFLSGEFTRARDVEAAPSGGTLDASTGVFCEARSPGCCQGCTIRRTR